MEPLQQGEIRIHLNGGANFVVPELNKEANIRCLGDNIARIEHWKPAVAPKAVIAPIPVKTTEKTKASLLGSIYKDDKVKVADLIAWIEKCTDLGDLGIVMKNEGRATAKKAYLTRINELT